MIYWWTSCECDVKLHCTSYKSNYWHNQVPNICNKLNYNQIQCCSCIMAPCWITINFKFHLHIEIWTSSDWKYLLSNALLIPLYQDDKLRCKQRAYIICQDKISFPTQANVSFCTRTLRDKLSSVWKKKSLKSSTGSLELLWTRMNERTSKSMAISLFRPQLHLHDIN